MARIQNVKCKQCRREGRKLFLKGERCYGPKCPIEKKGAVPPGVHGQKRRSKLSDYGVQLREKQKIKRMYGILERQMRNYFSSAKKLSFRGKARDNFARAGTGESLLQLLESRLDNVVFRSGLTPSRSVARQVVSHGQVFVNGKKVNIPSYQVKTNDVVSLGGKALEIPVVKVNLEKKVVPPSWLDKKAAVVKMLRQAQRKEIDADIDEQLIIEFYSR